MATGGDDDPLEYQALRHVRRDLIVKLVASKVDENLLIARARDRKIIQSIQASATVAPGQQSRTEKAEQLVNQVLEAVRTDTTKIDEFLQLLDDTSLGDIATHLRSKLHEYYTARRKDRESNRRPVDHSNCLPKLEHAPVSTEDSAYAEDRQTALQDDDGRPPYHQSDTAGTAQHQLATIEASESTSTFKPLSNSVVVVEQQHTSNLIVSTYNTSPSIADTQPHSDVLPSVATGNSAVILPETKRMQQENQDLQAQLAEKISHEEHLVRELRAMSLDKAKSEQKLKEKEEQLEQKEAQIKQMKAEMQRLQHELKEERENNVAEKKKLEEQIKNLEQQLKEKEDSFAKEKLELVEEKHKFELAIERMRTKEETMKCQILTEKCNVAELRVQIKEYGQKNAIDEIMRRHEQHVNTIKLEHQNSMAEKEKEIVYLRKQSLEPDTS